MPQPCHDFVAFARVFLSIAGLWLVVVGDAQPAGAMAGVAHDAAVAQVAADCSLGHAPSYADLGVHGHPAADWGHDHDGGGFAGGDCCMAGCSVGALAADAAIARPVLVGPIDIDGPDAVLQQLADPIGKPPKL